MTHYIHVNWLRNCVLVWLRSPVLWYATLTCCNLVGGYETLHSRKWLGHPVVSCVDMAF